MPQPALEDEVGTCDAAEDEDEEPMHFLWFGE